MTMNESEERALQQLELAEAKIKAVFFGPEFVGMNAKVVVAALMAVAAEVALASVTPDKARKFMIDLTNAGFDNLEYPVVQ
jgi:hypothetical protein